MLYLYDSDGEWIAIKKDKYLFNKNGEWIGWFPGGNEIAVDLDRNYLGTIYNDDRLLFNVSQFDLFVSPIFNEPLSLGYIKEPFGMKSKVVIPGKEDIDKRKLGL